MKRNIFPLILAVLSIAGCTGNDGKPKDLPPLFPCEITVTQDEKPLAGATISLETSGGTNVIYIPSGITDESGKAEISTYGFKGAPAGTYKVVVRKTIVEDVKQVTDAYGDLVNDNGVAYRTVEAKFSKPDTTPHEIEVTNSKKMTQATFDVGKAIKDKKE